MILRPMLPVKFWKILKVQKQSGKFVKLPFYNSEGLLPGKLELHPNLFDEDYCRGSWFDLK